MWTWRSTLPNGCTCGASGERRLHVGDDGQRLVGDLDERGGGARLLERLGGDERDRLALEADDVPGEHRLVAELEPVGEAAGHVGGGQHRGDAGRAQRRRDVDLADPRRGVRAADGDADEHVRGGQVGAVRVRAGHLRDAVDPPQALADPPRAVRRHVRRSAASRTASTIFR